MCPGRPQGASRLPAGNRLATTGVIYDKSPVSQGRHHAGGRRDRSRRGELQRLLGDLGTVLERQSHGTPALPAAGWYAELTNGDVVFLGDYGALAVSAILDLHRGVPADA